MTENEQITSKDERFPLIHNHLRLSLPRTY